MDAQQVRRPAAGVTLVELMVTVIIVAILAAIVFPTYSHNLRSGRRAAAKSLMMQVAQNEERHYTEKNEYDALNNIGYGGETITTDGAYYTLSIAAGSTGDIKTSYVISAAPASTDPECGTLTLSNTGAWTNSAGAPVTRC